MKKVGSLFQTRVNIPNKNFPSNRIFVRIEQSPMTNSWITSPPLTKPDENIHQFNPIENLLIEHASEYKN